MAVPVITIDVPNPKVVALLLAVTANGWLAIVTLTLIAELLTTFPVPSFTSTKNSRFPALPAVHVYVLLLTNDGVSLDHVSVSLL